MKDKQEKGAVTAVIWDYDGTLVDTRLKNYHISRTIQEVVTGRSAGEFEAFSSFEAYEKADRVATNWRAFCMNALELTEEQTNETGRLWSIYQLKDKTPTPLFDGIAGVITGLSGIPQGIVSQNSRTQIQNVLREEGLDPYFGSVVGYEQVDNGVQKPAPDGLFRCLRELVGQQELAGMKPGLVFYIGDHETDAQTAANANTALEERGLAVEFLSIGAFYIIDEDRSHWAAKPDFAAHTPAEITAIIAPYLP